MASIFDDSDSKGGATTEVVDPIIIVIIYLFFGFLFNYIIRLNFLSFGILF